MRFSLAHGLRAYRVTFRSTFQSSSTDGGPYSKQERSTAVVVCADVDALVAAVRGSIGCQSTLDEIEEVQLLETTVYVPMDLW